MKRWWMVLLIPFLFLCGPAQAQNYDFNPDSLQAFIDKDKNCSDFQNSMVNAQTHFEALQIILGDDDADPHGLDADGNGYACEGLDYNRVLNYRDTSGTLSFNIRTQEAVHSVRCPSINVSDWIDLREWSSKMRNAPLEQVDYLLTMREAECVDTVFEIYSENDPSN